ncbi:MAG: restriction endonuclease subunit S [Prolixibacteraceae bacterium]|nr:restriction endonuclease subunit S [Prolixibacteraceae bacterium]
MKEKLSLPKGWELKTIGDVCVSASSNVSQNKLADDEGDYPIFGASGLIKKVSFYHRDKPYLSIVKDGSGVGRITKMDAFTSVIGTLQYILPKENIDLDYLNYSLMSVDFKKYVAGAAIPHIYFKDYKNEPFLWMPLPEQQRIVSILDEAFSAIERSRNNAEQNLKNAKELFESYLKTAFENKVHGEKFDSLDSLCELIVDCEHKTAPTQETGYPSIRTPNIGKGELILENVNRVSYETYLQWTRRAVPKSGDLILAREAPAGNIAVIPENIEVCLGQRTVLLRPKKDRLVSKYLAYLILSKEVQEILLSHSTGATVQHINMKDIRAFKIYDLSDLKEQKAVVQKLDALRAETQKLEAIYQQKLLNLEELKKSVLQKAFNGELITEKLQIL